MTAPITDAALADRPVIVKTIEITICQPCLDGVGETCRTPECALFMHLVDLQIHPEIYRVIREWKSQL